MLTTLAEIAEVTGGQLVGADASITAVTLDSREDRDGALFVAIAGEHVDGHDFAEAAEKTGAAGVLASRPVSARHVLVADTVVALGAIARAHRRALDVRTVGVTGSAGKTTTKDLLAAVLAHRGPTIAPPGSYNNDIGLPLTVLRADASTRHLVLEMGSRAKGDIARLCAIGRPQVGVVLNVGSAHLGEFGSREAIADAKGELVELASELAVLNAADPLVRAMSARARADIRLFGVGGTVRAEQVRIGADGRPSYRLVADEGDAPVQLQLVGAHQIANSLAAATVALFEGMDISAIADALSAAAPASRWRMEVTERSDGVLVINDAYNANPDSVRSAIDAAMTLGAGRSGSVWAVLGAMLELGDSSEDAHDEIGHYATSRGVDRIVAVGPGAEGIRRGAGARAVGVPDVDEARELLRNELAPGDVVLIKASRGAGLERVALALLDNDGVQDESGRRG
jgi:UDP-N-acetylmuramoyl-tripeptide--D-alanyl-D-alanine ligase